MKTDKGEYKGECYRSACPNKNAQLYNHSTKKYYCQSCAFLINEYNPKLCIKLLGHKEDVKCEGSCRKHKGKVKKVTIKGDVFTTMEFNYCEEAIAEDRRRGFTVEVEDENIEDVSNDETGTKKRLFLISFLGEDERGEIIKGVEIMAESSEQAMSLVSQLSKSTEIYSAIEIN